MKLRFPRRAVVVLTAGLMLTTVACWAHKYRAVGTKIVPAASGTVNTKTDKNGNVTLDLQVKNLAKPGTLTPPAAAYVVWFEEEGSPARNEGQLLVSDDLKGEFKSTTPYHNFELRVTAETDPQSKQPSERTVMQTRISD
ncbi:MAG TPA: hypothetical protein VN661_13415 [Candidatus Acidoferrales bacterium]|nr:hypothetical protein [Candidatus Acidoferrales bacterium]